MRSFLLFLCLSTSVFAANGTESAKSVVLRQGNYQIKQLVSPGFENLPLERKLFAMELAEAIEAGHEIVWLQNNEHTLAIRDLMHELWKYSYLFSPTEKAGLSEYLFLLHANHGNYDERKNKKFVPEKLTHEQVSALARLVDQEKLRRGIKAEKDSVFNYYSLEDLVGKYKKEIFSLEHLTALHADGNGQDIVRDSAANYYGTGLTKADIDALPKEMSDHFLSYPYRKFTYTGEKQPIQLQIHRIGDRFGEYLQLIDHHFAKALQYATKEESAIITAYRVALYSGDPQDLAYADGLWAEHKPKDIDFVANFIEVYGDPLNKRGEWEGFLILLNQTPEDMERVENIRKNATYFEAMMPVDEEFKKKGDFTPPKAEGAYLMYSAGANGEKPFAGVNLPNTTIDPTIHEKHGSKSYTADNVMTDIGSEGGKYSTDRLQAFYAPEYHELLKQVDSRLVRQVQVEFHEILGHGSGRVRDGVKDTMLEDYYSAMEEGRAEVASLYHMLDTKIRELGIVPKTYTDEELRDFQTAAVLSFFSDHIRTYERLPASADRIRQAHQWGRQVMLARLLKAGALQLDASGAEGAPVVRNIDLAKARQALGTLWHDLQKGKSTGDLAFIKQIFETDGAYTAVHKSYRESLVKALDAMNVPREHAYLNPQFELVKDENGRPVDVRLVYEEAGQQQFDDFVDRQVERADTMKAKLTLCKNLLIK